MFANYLSKPNVTQPLFTQYCDGRRVSCPGWMTQWGSKSLADDGLTAIQILRYYYGDTIYINTSETISGIPSSYPGYELTIGSSGDKVSQLQRQLARIDRVFARKLDDLLSEASEILKCLRRLLIWNSKLMRHSHGHQ